MNVMLDYGILHYSMLTLDYVTLHYIIIPLCIVYYLWRHRAGAKLRAVRVPRPRPPRACLDCVR